MTILQDEIPFTNEAIRIYIKEAEKQMDKLKPLVNQYNGLKRRIKMAQERLDSHDSRS